MLADSRCGCDTPSSCRRDIGCRVVGICDGRCCVCPGVSDLGVMALWGNCSSISTSTGGGGTRSVVEQTGTLTCSLNFWSATV
jgi:hypothetical protein